MKNFNLSEWALRHRSLVLFLMILLMVAGIMSYFRLGRAEDPEFTFKVMVVRTFWPGATTREIEQQITERVEKKLQEIPYLDVVKSYSKPGESLVFLILKDYAPPKEVPNVWYQVRKKLTDVRHTLPEGVRGPFFNDEFGDTFGIIYALTGEGYTLPQLRKEADDMARHLKALPDVGKVELFGVQDEKIFIEISTAKLATLGLDPLFIAKALQEQNAMVPAGLIDTPQERIYLRVTGDLATEEQIREIGIRAGSRVLRLGDIATVRRGLADPPSPKFRWQGREGIGIAVSMTKGGNVLDLGEHLDKALKHFGESLPVGMVMEKVSDQPAVVKRSIDEFMQTLAEAVIIVLAVSFLSLGWRTGMVVALSIPLVLAVTFLCMRIFNIDLQRISLGALIIALGLLVDDAIIAVEMMVLKIEEGMDKFAAATFAYTSTAFPMLTGTLITAAGFTSSGFAKSSAGEYTFSIFAVVGIALVVSWLVAVIFTPYIGYMVLDENKLRRAHATHGDSHSTPFYRRLRRAIEWCVRHRRMVIVMTVAAFILSIVAFRMGVERQFFPASNRPELLIDLRLSQGASIDATARDVYKVEQILKTDPAIQPHLQHFVSYVGTGSPRFYLPLDQQMPNDNFAQFVVMTKDSHSREVVRQRLMDVFEQDFLHLSARVQRLENGPPVGFPVLFRVSGPDPKVLREASAEMAAIMRVNSHLNDVNADWGEMTKQLRLEVDQDKARALGVSSQSISQALATFLNGLPITQFREGDLLIDVVGRADSVERKRLSAVEDIQLHTRDGRTVPLAQLVRVSYALEEGLIWRRDRLPTISVRADLRGKAQAPDVSNQLDPQFNALREKLRSKFGDDYRIEKGGTAEESGKAEKSIQAVMPMMMLGVLFLLMVQLQSFSKLLLVLLTAPLGLIGVTLSLLLFQTPFGFVAQLGVIALAGMIMRNAVILVDQIDHDIVAGKETFDAVVDSTVRRFRPIVLTALAAVLAMIPLSRSVFWGPMAIAIMGGLIVATALTLFFLPALYAAWFKVKGPMTDRGTVDGVSPV